jgi:cytoskeletal protein CcmA (bactofilin family)
MELSDDLGGRLRSTTSTRSAALPLLTAAILAFCGCDGSSNSSDRVNGEVHVPAGRGAGAAETVNGSIHIDPDAAVTTAKTVNGGVTLGSHATADSLATVNGNITIDGGSRVSGGVDSVNGDIAVGNGALVSGSLENVNGVIRLSAAHVDGGIATVNGDIDIRGDSRVERGIHVRKPESSGLIRFGNDVPRIIIGPGATVVGELRFEREVKLYLSDRATVGNVIGATAIPFTGDDPPR